MTVPRRPGLHRLVLFASLSLLSGGCGRRQSVPDSPPPLPKISYRVPSSPRNQLMFSITPRTDSFSLRAA